MSAMRDVDTAPTPTTAERTLLVVTHHRDERLLSLIAGADTTALACTPADTAAILRHVAVDVVVILDDVSDLDRALLEGDLPAHTVVLATPAPVVPMSRRSSTIAPLSLAA
jgi:hypothetical protein